MKLTPRIVVPIALATACAAGLIIFLWWQLQHSSSILQRANIFGTATGSELEVTSPTDAPIDPRDKALLHLRQGDLYALRGEWGAAQVEYEKSVQEDGGLPALRKLARAQLQRRDMEGAKATIRSLKSAGARAEDILLLESIVALRTGELVEARALLEAAEESPQKQYGLALLSIIEGNHEKSRDYLVQVVSGWEPVLRSYARLLLSAYDEYALFPESSDLHLTTLLSRALAQVQECELALPLLVQVTGQRSNYRDAWIVQGYCELTTERFEQALASLEHAYGLDPQKPEIQYFLGRTYASLEDHGNAITFFEYALTNGFQPVPEVRRLIAISALKEENADLARQQYEFMTQAEDATLDAFRGFVTVSIALDQKEEAYLKAQEATKRFSNDAEAFELLGTAAIEAGHKEEARTALERAVQLNPYLLSAKEKLQSLE